MVTCIVTNPVNRQEFLSAICCPTVEIVQKGGERVIHKSNDRNYLDLWDTDFYTQHIIHRQCQSFEPSKDFPECSEGLCEQIKSNQPVLVTDYVPGVGYLIKIEEVESDTGCKFKENPIF